MKDRQTSDMANSGKSGGVNLQGGDLTCREHKPDTTKGSLDVPAKGVSNGGK